MSLRFSGIAILLTISSCDAGNGRIPSRERMENVCKVKLPADYTVIKDEYQDMLTDYCILYDLRLADKSIAEFTSSIQSSAWFNARVRHNSVLSEEFYTEGDTTQTVWCRSQTGYMFHRVTGSVKGSTEYWIWVDTTAGTVSYSECAD